jgi:hypothetical protein
MRGRQRVELAGGQILSGQGRAGQDRVRWREVVLVDGMETDDEPCLLGSSFS